MVSSMMLVVVLWYSCWRMMKEDWSGANANSTCQINERY